MRVAYVVSRFPTATETFVVREMNGVDAAPDADVDLYALFPPDRPFVHPAAERWVPVAHQPDPRAAIAGLLWWTAKRPGAMARIVGAVIGGYGRSPGRLVRALATLPIAAAHAKRMRADGVDRIHAHFANYPALAAWIAGRLLGIPYTVTAHAHDLFVDQSNLARLVDDAAAFVTISEYNRAFIADLGVDGTTPVKLVHCGVDLERLAFRPRELPATGPVRLLCVAGLQEKKGHRVLFDALARRLPGFDRLTLDLVGAGPLDDELRALVGELGLADRVTFHGALDEAQVAERLDAADALVLPSIIARNGEMEGIPVAIMEALAVGLPVVSSSLSGLPELLRREATCLLATPGDATSLAAALRSLLDAPDAAAERAAAGRRLVEAEFDIRQTAARMLALFRGA